MPKSGNLSKSNIRILEIIKEVNADILVLTETNSVIHPGPDYITCVASRSLPLNQLYDNCIHHEGENRTTIWAKYLLNEQIKTSNDDTNTCCSLSSPFGSIIVYGTIIGIQGHKKPWFEEDLNNLIKDKDLFSDNCIIAGDFNLSFLDNYYPNVRAKKKLELFFAESGLVNITKSIPKNIDHIVISKKTLDLFKPEPIVEFMPMIDKSVSDHKWVSVMFEWK